MVTAYWDEDFQVHALKPRFKDHNGVPSPAAVAPGASVEIALTPGTKAIKLFPDTDTATTVEVSFSNTAVDPIYEDGTVQVDLTLHPLEVPTQGVFFVKIKNIGTLAANVSYMLLEV